MQAGAEVGSVKAQETAAAVQRLRKARRRRNRAGYVGLGMILAIAVFAIVGPWLIPHAPNQQNLGASTLPIWSEVDGSLHVLGTDPLGRDTLARLAAGARASLTVVLASLAVGGGVGVLLGLLAGFFGGWADGIIMRVVDAQLSVPSTIFAMLISAVLGAGFTNTALALGFASWPIYARILRAEVLQVREREFVVAAVTFGVSTARRIWVHVLPNVLGSLAVVGTLELGRMIILESTLSFLGLGMQPPDASWGSMIRQGQSYIYTAWWLATLPGVFIIVTVLGMNLLGDWLRDLLDPNAR